MKDLRGRNALLTGAAGGLGRHMALAIAERGVNLAVSGRNVEALERLRDEVRARGVQCEVVSADLTDLDSACSLVSEAESAIGPIDILVNNAGIETATAYPAAPREELEQMVTVNLTAPMLLVHAALPGMMERGRGHVVNIASLAGKSPPAYAAPYGATKAGLIGLTRALRGEYADSPVGLSVVCPGFIAQDGMYGRMEAEGIRAPAVVGAARPEKVAEAVVASIVEDAPEVIVNARPVRPLLTFAEAFPRLAERAVERIGVADVFREVAKRRGRLTAGGRGGDDRTPAAAK